MKNFLRYNWPSILWAAFILVICLMPGRHIPKVSIPNFDKVVHTTIYMIFAVLTYFGWTRQSVLTILRSNTALKVVVVLALYGLTVEILQETLTADRHFELLDELANTSGATIGAIVASYLLPIAKT